MSHVRLALSDSLPSPPTERTPRTRRERLDQLQEVAKRYRKVFNAKRLQYQQWHQRRSTSFVETLKTIQCFSSSAVAPSVDCIADFRELRALAIDLRRAGRIRTSLQLIDEFLHAWRDFLELGESFHLEFVTPLTQLLQVTDAFRHKSVKVTVMQLVQQLQRETHEKFDCRQLHDVQDNNLYTFSVSVRDSRFLGIMQILPRVLQTAAQICYYTEQLVSNDTQ